MMHHIKIEDRCWVNAFCLLFYLADATVVANVNGSAGTLQSSIQMLKLVACVVSTRRCGSFRDEGRNNCTQNSSRRSVSLDLLFASKQTVKAHECLHETCTAEGAIQDISF